MKLFRSRSAKNEELNVFGVPRPVYLAYVNANAILTERGLLRPIQEADISTQTPDVELRVREMAFTKALAQEIGLEYDAASYQNYSLVIPLKYREPITEMFDAMKDSSPGDDPQHLLQNKPALLENILQILPAFDKNQDLPDEFTATMREILNAQLSNDQTRSVELFTKALSILDPEKNMVLSSLLQYGLATSLKEIQEGDPLDNIERAIEAYEIVLKTPFIQAIPQIWAHTVIHLASAYENRLVGDKNANHENAINAYKAALNYFPRQIAPDDWAMIAKNLAMAYWSRTMGDHEENTNLAIDLLNQTLEIWTPDNASDDWASAMRNLATCYLFRKQGGQTNNIEQTIEYCQVILAVQTKENSYEGWKLTMRLLGQAVEMRIQGNSAENILRATQIYEEIYKGVDSEKDPYWIINIAQGLGRIYSKRKEWRKANEVLRSGIEAGKLLYSYAYAPTSKKKYAETNIRIYDQIIESSLYLGQETNYSRNGLMYAEMSKSRDYLEYYSSSNIPPPAGVPKIIMLEEARLLNELNKNQLKIDSIDINSKIEREVATERKALLKDLNTIWETLVQEYPSAKSYVDIRRAAFPQWKDLENLSKTLGPKTALVEFYMLRDNIGIFVLRDGWDSPRVYNISLTIDQLLHRYLYPYLNEMIQPKSTIPPAYSWLSLGEILLAPIKECLDGVSRVCMVPHKILSIIPLHALNLNGRPFIDYYEVVYAPSALTLIHLLKKVPTQVSNNVLVMAYTPKDYERNIFNKEAEIIANVFNSSPLLNNDASIESFKERAQFADYIHLSCHGRFRYENPLESTILLSNGELSARDLMTINQHADLVTLSACETGMITTGTTNENLGFSRSLLYGGANSALLTFWSVNANSTLEWMENFYRFIVKDSGAEGQLSKSNAFRRATLALRDNVDEPYYWAPFSLVGNWQ